MTAAYPFGTNRISYGIGANVVVVTEALDTKGTVYQNIAVLSTPSNLESSASLDGKCSMSMTVYHSKQLITVASQAKIWLSEVNGRISSQVIKNSSVPYVPVIDLELVFRTNRSSWKIWSTWLM